MAFRSSLMTLLLAAVTLGTGAHAQRPPRDWTRPPGSGLAGTAYDNGYNLRIGAAANGDSLVGELSYRNAVLEQFGIVSMEGAGFLANLAPDAQTFASGNYNWANFDKVVDFACENNMAVRITPLFYDTTDGLGGAAPYLQGQSASTVAYWMRTHAWRVMYRVRERTYWRCPGIQIYVDVVNEGIQHQERPPYASRRIWAITNQLSTSTSATFRDYHWVQLAFQYTRAVDDEIRGFLGGWRPAKLYYNENAAENALSGWEGDPEGFGRKVYNYLRQWKQAGWRIDGVGLQGHLNESFVRDWLGNTTQWRVMQTLNAYGALGFETQITEADYILKFNRNNGLYWQMDSWHNQCTNTAYAGDYDWAPPAMPRDDDHYYNKHPAELVALFRACRDSNSCTAFVTWGVFDHSNNGKAAYHCQNVNDPAYRGPFGAGHPVLLDCTPGSDGLCSNDGSYYRKRAWWWLWSAVWGG